MVEDVLSIIPKKYFVERAFFEDSMISMVMKNQKSCAQSKKPVDIKFIGLILDKTIKYGNAAIDQYVIEDAQEISASVGSDFDNIMKSLANCYQAKGVLSSVVSFFGWGAERDVSSTQSTASEDVSVCKP